MKLKPLLGEKEKGRNVALRFKQRAYCLKRKIKRRQFMTKRMLEGIKLAIKILGKVQRDMEADNKYLYERIDITEILQMLRRMKRKHD